MECGAKIIRFLTTSVSNKKTSNNKKYYFAELQHITNIVTSKISSYFLM